MESQVRECLQAFSDLIDGAMEPSQAESIVRQLGTDDEVSALYLDFIRLDVDLRWAGTMREQQAMLASGAAVAQGCPEEQPSDPIVARLPSPVAAARRAALVFSRPLLMRVAMVAMILYGTFLLMVWNLRRENGGPVAATLVGSNDCQWQSEPDADAVPSPAIGAKLGRGKSLRLESGSVDVHFAGGAIVRVTGRSEFRLESDNSGKLLLGRISAVVPKEAIGFAIETPSMRVVDLGTEFEVEVTKRGGSEVRVLKGVVETHLRGKSATSSAGLPPTRLIAGEGLRVDERGSPTQLNADATGVFRAKSKQFAIGRSPADLGGSEFGVDGTVCICTEPAAKAGRAHELRFFSRKADRWITPLVFSLDKQGTYTLTGIGESIRSTVVDAAERAPFKLVAGSDRLEANTHYFGYVDGRIDLENGKFRLTPDRGVADCVDTPDESGAWIWTDGRADFAYADFRLGLAWSVNGEKASSPIRLYGANPEQAAHPWTGGRRIAVQLVLEENGPTEGSTK